MNATPCPPSQHGLHDEACTAATTAVIVGCVVPDCIMQGLQELKPMTKDTAVSHDSATGCDYPWQFDFQFYGLSYLQFDRQERRNAGFTNVESPTRQEEPIFRANRHFRFPLEPRLTAGFSLLLLVFSTLLPDDPRIAPLCS